ncbi:MAG: hypothetical protein JWO72_1793 [Caulobacteraceae bacterium]|jgi:hypothetical protein|nr:hypothetical protein [Caulobacteraceae bacterium]
MPNLRIESLADLEIEVEDRLADAIGVVFARGSLEDADLEIIARLETVLTGLRRQYAEKHD